MSKATIGLRRAGIGGLAAVVAAGTALVGAGSAFAWTATSTVAASIAGPTTLYPGSNNQALAAQTLTVSNNWNVGDTITLSLVGGNCTVSGGGFGFAAAPAVSAAWQTGASTSDTAPTYTVALSQSSGACTTAGVNDVATLTFTNSSTGTATDKVDLTVGANVNVGSAVGAGAVTETVATAGTGTATVSGSPVSVGSVAQAKIAAATTAGAPSATVNAGNVTVTEVTAGTVGTSISFALSTLSGTAVWATAGTLSYPGGTVAASSATGAGTSTITYSGLTATTTPGTFTLSGATVTLPAVTGVTQVAAAGLPPQNYVAAVNTKWTGGSDRYATSATLFQNNYASGVGTVVVASGMSYPDALSASFLAGAKGTGVLLTDPNNLPASTQQAIVYALNGASPMTVYVVGGPGAVSDNVVNQIKALGSTGGGPLTSGAVNVIRLGGSDRYATNALVLAQAAASGQVSLTAGSATKSAAAILATGSNFADALSAGPIASQGFPLLLNSGASLTTAATNYLTTSGIKQVIIVGGIGAVPATVATQLTGMGITVLRLAGADRTTTAEAVANFEIGTPAASGTTSVGLGWNGTTAYLARGDNFADALSAGPIAGAGKSPILLTTSPSALGAGASDFLMTQTAARYGTINALGLTGAINGSTLQAAAVASAG